MRYLQRSEYVENNETTNVDVTLKGTDKSDTEILDDIYEDFRKIIHSFANDDLERLNEEKESRLAGKTKSWNISELENNINSNNLCLKKFEEGVSNRDNMFIHNFNYGDKDNKITHHLSSKKDDAVIAILDYHIIHVVYDWFHLPSLNETIQLSKT